MKLIKIALSGMCLLVLYAGHACGQEGGQRPDSAGVATSESSNPDSVMAVVGLAGMQDSVSVDTTRAVEEAPLDIAQDRGIFILTPDGNMQLRILGSVRFLIVYDDIDMDSKNNFRTYSIVTGDQSQRHPNYYSGLEQSRLGFEVTRKTSRGDMFIRLETDFTGSEGFRIRHAYGQFDRFLLGQSWSLFSHLNALPTVVDFANPTGSVVVRTPQMRFTPRKPVRGFTISIGLEYFESDFTYPDPDEFESFQIAPDVTARASRSMDWGLMQVSGIVPFLSGRGADGELVIRSGWGVSLSTMVKSWAKGKWYTQMAGGRAVASYFSDFGGQGLDIVFDAESEDFAMPLAFGGYVSYEHRWREDLYSGITWGIVMMEKVSFMPDDSFFRGQSFRINTFWDVIQGARVGAEFIHGIRVDKGNARGTANRINVLTYFDF